MSPRARSTPEEQAKAAIRRRGVDRGHVTVRVSLRQATAEKLAARAIREERNLEGLVAELVERAAR